MWWDKVTTYTPDRKKSSVLSAPSWLTSLACMVQLKSLGYALSRSLCMVEAHVWAPGWLSWWWGITESDGSGGKRTQGEEMGSNAAHQPPLFYEQSTKGEQLAQGENSLVSVKHIFQVQDSGWCAQTPPWRKTLEKDGTLANVSQLNEYIEFRIFSLMGLCLPKTHVTADRFLPHRL